MLSERDDGKEKGDEFLQTANSRSCPDLRNGHSKTQHTSPHKKRKRSKKIVTMEQ